MAGRSRFVRRAAASAALLACAGDPSRPPAPSTIEPSSQPGSQATVGSALTPAPTFVVRDAQGEPIAGLPIVITVAEGGGTLTGAPRRTAAGPTPVGTWTIGNRAGRNVLSVRVGGLAPLQIAVTGIPDAPKKIVATAGNDQTGLAGDELAQPLAVRVTDRFGNGISGLEIALSIGTGNGIIVPPNLTTEEGGAAGGIRWRLGNRGGEQRLVASAGTLTTTFTAAVRSDFALDLRFVGDLPPAAIQASFHAASERVRAAVVGDLNDVVLQSFDVSRCGVTSLPLSETVDDLVVFAHVTTIDGPGKILGSAGPCLTRSQSSYTVIGVMRFDVDDLSALASSNRLDAVILHEMLHVVGVGTLWRSKELLIGSGTQDPRFAGAQGALRCLAAGGDFACADSRVPVENTGGSGTAEAHWRESVFDAELMTGFAEISPNMPFSAMTIASLEDLGLTPNVFAADPYFLPMASLRLSPGDAATSSAPAAPWEVLELPQFEVTPGGWVRRVAWK